MIIARLNRATEFWDLRPEKAITKTFPAGTIVMGRKLGFHGALYDAQLVDDPQWINGWLHQSTFSFATPLEALARST